MLSRSHRPSKTQNDKSATLAAPAPSFRRKHHQHQRHQIATFNISTKSALKKVPGIKISTPQKHNIKFVHVRDAKKT
jgi:hypothetical protein